MERKKRKKMLFIELLSLKDGKKKTSLVVLL